MPDYNRAVATARRLIGEAGRSITIRTVTPGVANANDPLAGPAALPTGISAVGVWVEPSSLQSLGMSSSVAALFATMRGIFLVADNGVNDFKAARFVDDGSDRWAVARVEQLKPGNVGILYFIGVNRP